MTFSRKKLAGLLAGASLAFATALNPVAADPAAATQNITGNIPSAKNAKYANGIYLAYVKSSDNNLNNVTEKGLQDLQKMLYDQTSLDPEKEIIALDIEKDDISLFPYIYWPVARNEKPLSEAAQKKVQHYIDTGGLLMFDVMYLNATLANGEALKKILGNVNLGPVIPLPQDHTLTRTFFLTNGLPGGNNVKNVYIQQQGATEQGAVTSVIIASRDWARAWDGITLTAGSKEQQMALRAGINAVLYAFSGDYKGDQFQTKQILDRIKKKGRSPQ